jgi:hypothetical protein
MPVRKMGWAKENVHIEALNGRFKEENRLLFREQEDLESLRTVIDQRIRYYNQVPDFTRR